MTLYGTMKDGDIIISHKDECPHLRNALSVNLRALEEPVEDFEEIGGIKFRVIPCAHCIGKRFK